jgi:hypothetical protein
MWHISIFFIATQGGPGPAAKLRIPACTGLRLINTGKGSIVRCLLITALRHMLPRYIDIYASPEDPEARQHLAADASGMLPLADICCLKVFRG